MTRRTTAPGGGLVRSGVGRLVLGLGLALALAGCASGPLAPFETTPDMTPDAGVGEATRVGICYSGATSDAEAIRAVAAASCPHGTTPRLVGREFNLSCPLLTPARATFACLKP